MSHLSLAALADLLAAEGNDADVAHVAGCGGCAGRLDELAAAEVEVSAVLAALPAPPVPDEVAARLQAAFDAEPPLAPAATAPVSAEAAVADGADGTPRLSGATVTPFPVARRRSAWVPAAAAVAVLASGGILGVALLSGGVGGSDEAATSAAAPDSEAAPADPFSDLTRSETGTDYAADGTLAAALPALLGGSAEPLTGALARPESAEQSAEQPAPAAEAAPVPAESGPAAASRDSAEGLGTGDFAAPELDRLRTSEGLASCLAALLPPEDDAVRPLAVDYAVYAGQPALVVVLPAGGAGAVEVFVAGAGCAVQDAQLLFFTQLDRP